VLQFLFIDSESYNGPRKRFGTIQRSKTDEVTLPCHLDTAARLVHAGYAVYGIDQEGHGKSSGLKGYISSFSNIVKDRADYFKSVCGKN
jgi:pimeloyl-ACP methyl ester carboxylesterase